MKIEDVKLYLPKFLSSDSKQELFSNLKDFPDSLDERVYTSYLRKEKVIFQGDGIRGFLVVRLPGADVKEAPCIVLSNTCDIDQSNLRNFPSQIIYSPIIELDRYIDSVLKKTDKSPEQLERHLQDIKKQRITQIFYLPSYGEVINESIVFLDRICHIDNNYIRREDLERIRLFTLSDFGFYLFLFKLSLHFTRIQDKVERKSGSPPPPPS